MYDDGEEEEEISGPPARNSIPKKEDKEVEPEEEGSAVAH